MSLVLDSHDLRADFQNAVQTVLIYEGQPLKPAYKRENTSHKRTGGTSAAPSIQETTVSVRGQLELGVKDRP